jgi:hypothetical protein
MRNLQKLHGRHNHPLAGRPCRQANSRIQRSFLDQSAMQFILAGNRAERAMALPRKQLPTREGHRNGILHGVLMLLMKLTGAPEGPVLARRDAG